MNVERLPKWAQEHIAKLERDLKYAQERIVVFEGKQIKSNTYEEYGRGTDKPQFTYLRQGAVVTFDLEPHKGWHRAIDCRITDDGVLHVMGRGSIVVMPSSSNVVNIKCEV